MIQEPPSDRPAWLDGSGAGGGGGAFDPAASTVAAQANPRVAEGREPLPPVSDAELARLHVRVIALEAMVAALLVDAPEEQLARARAMAAYITPRPGAVPHPLTERAAEQMEVLLVRARRFGERDDAGDGDRSGQPGVQAR